jgi:IS30 family transposase
MKVKLSNAQADFEKEKVAMEKLIKRMTTISRAIELFNESDWKVEEVARWLQYEKDLAIVEAKLYEEKQQ